MPPTTILARMTESKKIVLIIAESNDYHALGVSRAIDRLGGEPRVVDNSDFPALIQIVFAHDSQASDCEIIFADRTSLKLSQVAGVWWRRPQKYRINETAHPTLKKFAFDECREAFLGSLAACVGNFMNPVGHSRFATHKLVQLVRARNVGLMTPETLVTNCPEAGRAFALSRSRSIYKTFTGCDFGFYETRLLKEDDARELERLRIAPVIQQEAISGHIDIRATVVGERVFAAELRLENSAHPVDGRIDRVPVHRHDLPAAVVDKLVRLTRDFGLIYSAIDLRLTPNGDYVFFELNPEGQFLWVEIEASLGICDAIARRLLFGAESVVVREVASF